MLDLVGKQFGNYQLLRLLGRGGFAEVYLGQHLLLSTQQAAIKILSTRLNEEVFGSSNRGRNNRFPGSSSYCACVGF